MNRWLTMIVLLHTAGWICPAAAQQLQKRSVKGISASYYNQLLIIPGFRVGYEFSVWEKEKMKANNKIRINSVVSRSFLGFYAHQRVNTGVFAKTQIGFRFSSPAGIYFEPLHVGLGYMQLFLAGNTYEVNSSGSIDRVKLASNGNVLLPYFSVIGVGYDFRKKGKPWSTFFSIDGFVRRPEKNSTAFRVAIPVGFTYYLNYK